MTLGGAWTFKIELSPRRGLNFHKNLQSMKEHENDNKLSENGARGGMKNHLGDPKINVLPAWELNFKHFLFLMIFEGFLKIAILPAWELNLRENCPHIHDFSIT